MPAEGEDRDAWQARGHAFYANGDMENARRCYRTAAIVHGDFGRRTRFLWKVARNVGDHREANRLRAWIYAATGSDLDLPLQEVPQPPPSSDGAERASDATGPAPSPQDGAATSFPAVAAALPAVALVAAYWIAANLALDMWVATAAGPVPDLPLTVAWLLTGLSAIAAAELTATLWLRLRAGTTSMLEAALWRIPLYHEERLRPRQAAKFVQTLLPHPFAAYVHRRRRLDSPLAIRRGSAAADGNETVGVQGTAGPDFPFDLASDQTFRVLLVGGSVAEQFFSYERADFVSPIQSAIRRRCEGLGLPTAEVWCGAVGGWTAINFVPFAQTYGRRFNCIVSLFGFNDFMSRHTLTSRAARVFYESIVQDANLDIQTVRTLEHLIRDRIEALKTSSRSLLPGLRILMQRRQVFELLDRLAETRAQPPRADGPLSHGLVHSLGNVTGETNLSETVQNIRNLQDYCSRYGIQLVNFVQPIAPFGKPLTSRERKLLNARLAERKHKPLEFRGFVDALMAELRPHTAIHDMGKIFEAVTGQVYYDDCHFVMDADGNGTGSDLVAARIAEAVVAAMQAAATGADAARPVQAPRT